MRKKSFLLACILMISSFYSCNNVKNSEIAEKPTDSVIKENTNEVFDLENTIIEEAKYFKSQSILEDINSQDVIGFGDEGAYISEYQYVSYMEFNNFETGEKLDIETQISDINDISYSDDYILIGGFTKEGEYHIDMLDKNFSNSKNIVTEDFVTGLADYDSESIIACVSGKEGNKYLKKYSLSGEVLETIDLASKLGLSEILVSDMYVSQKGNIILEITIDRTRDVFCVLDEEYNVICDAFDFGEIKLNDDMIFTYGKIIGENESGDIIFSNISEFGEIFLYRYDFQTDMAEEIDCLSGLYIYEGNGDYNFFYKNNEGFFGYRLADKSSTLLIESDIPDTAIMMVSDNSVYMAERIDNYRENVYLYNIESGKKTEYFSVDSNQIISMQKALNNGLIQLVEEYEDKCVVHIFNIESSEKNVVEIEYENSCAVSDVLVVDINNILVDFYNENDGSNSLRLYDGQGKEVSVISISSNEDIRDMVLSPDGRVFARLQTDMEEYFKEIFVDKSELSKQNITANSYILWTCNGKDKYDFFYVTEKGVYGVEFDQNVCTLLFSKQESDVPYDISIHDFCYLDDNTFYIATFESVYKLLYSEKVSDDRTKINIADLSYIPNEVVEAFEREYPQYDINIIDYTDMTADDFTNRIDLDIISGDSIDLIYFNHQGVYDATNHNDKNAYVDYYELMENDSDFSKDDYIWNVFEAMEDDGALYQLTPEFFIKTIVGDSDFADKNHGWNVEEFGEYIVSDDASVYNPEYDTIIGAVCRTGNFVDYEGTKANFDNEAFTNILSGTIEKFEIPETKWTDNSIRFMDICDLDELYIMQQYDMRGEELSNIGFPDVKGNGAFIVPFAECSILKNSENIDASWCFVKYLLSKEYNENFGMPGLSVRRDVTDEKMKSLKKGEGINTEMIDEDGNVVTLGLPDDKILDKTLEIIEDAEMIYKDDITLDDIVGSECNAYISDAQDIYATVRNIQSRVQIYLSEQY